MSMTWREAGLRDVHYVLGKLSNVTQGEMRTCGLTSSEVLWKARTHWLHTGRAYVFLDNATPVAVFGFNPDRADHEVLTTWLISTQGFHRPKWTLFSRKFLVKVQKDHPGYRILTTTYSSHPSVPRWFQILGFEMIGKGDDFRILEYVGT